MDKHSFILTTTEIMAGNHNDQYELMPKAKQIFADLKRLGIPVAAAYFNMDAGFDTKAVGKVCFNRQVIPNIAKNKRNRKKGMLGP